MLCKLCLRRNCPYAIIETEIKLIILVFYTRMREGPYYE